MLKHKNKLKKKKWNLQTGWRKYDNVSVYDGWIGPDEDGKYKIDKTKTATSGSTARC